MIVVSHDRYFLDNIVDHLFVLPGDGSVKDFPGNYSDYRQWLQQQDADKKAQEAERAAKRTDTADTKPQASRQRPVKLTFKEKKELEQLEAELETFNAEKDALDALFNSGETITDIAEKSQRYTELTALIDEKEMRWLELSEKA